MIRGEDLLSSTPRQVLVHQALGAPVPSFAHLPLLFGPDRKRLSKRHGATSVEELREAGYLAEAVVNFLALLGWHFDSERELFTLSELIGLFSLERVNPAPAVFDAKKLEWMNGVYLRALPTFDLAERLTAYLAERGSPLASQPERVVEVTPLAQEKIATLAEFEPLCSFLFGPVEIDQEAWDKVAGHERAAEILAAVRGGARGLRLDGRGGRGDAARRLRRARAQAARRLRPRARGDHRHAASRRACSRASTCSAARRRSRASAPPPRASRRDALRDERRQRVRAGRERGALARREHSESRTSGDRLRGCARTRPGQRREGAERKLHRAARDRIAGRCAAGDVGARQAVAAAGGVGEPDRDRARERAPQLWRGRDEAQHPSTVA